MNQKRGGIQQGKQRASPQKHFKPGKDGSSVGTVIMSANEITLNRPLANKQENGERDSEPTSAVVTKRPRRGMQASKAQ